MDILEEMKRRIVLFDGGMGSLLQEAGLKMGELPETWNIRHPEIVTRLQKEYLDAGADIITSNTFGANRLKYRGSLEAFAEAGDITAVPDGEYPLEEIVRGALACAREAVRQAGHGVVALDLGPTGHMLKPMGDLDFEDAVSL